MIKKVIHLHITFLLFFAGLTSAISQPCKTAAENTVGEMVRTKPVPPSGLLSPATFKFVAQEMAIIDSIGKMFYRINPKPLGARCEWTGVFMPVDSVTAPDYTLANYMYDAPYVPYVCMDGKVRTYPEANGWVRVSVNDTYAAMTDRLNFDSLFILPPQRGTLAGYPLFFPPPPSLPGDDWESPSREFYAVLIHYPGKLPYRNVSKDEYLDICLKLIDSEESKILNGFREEKDLDPSVPERVKQRYMDKRDYIDALRKLNAKTLDQPAIIKIQGWEILGYQKLEGDNYVKNIFTTASRGFQVVRRNPEYADQSREKWKPQYIWMQWRKSLGAFYPKHTQIMDDLIRTQFDFARLGKLLEE